MHSIIRGVMAGQGDVAREGFTLGQALGDSGIKRENNAWTLFYKKDCLFVLV